MPPAPDADFWDRYDTAYVSKIPLYYDNKNLQDVQKSRENLIHYMGVAERTSEKLHFHCC